MVIVLINLFVGRLPCCVHEEAIFVRMYCLLQQLPSENQLLTIFGSVTPAPNTTGKPVQ
jgi:hypothetical protein